VLQVIKEIALTEPLVDVVEGSALISDCTSILDIDLLKCTKADLAFTADFTLHFTRADKMHALVAYFDCSFSRLPRPVSFSTAPFAPYTHWKQVSSVTSTVYYGSGRVYIYNARKVIICTFVCTWCL
jgi:type I protein arginine methyltransferase